MKGRLLFFLFISFFLDAALQSAGAEVFSFKFREGDSYKINSLVKEDVYIDRYFSHTAEISNRITVNVSDVQDEGERSSARHECTFMTSERNNGRGFVWGHQYESVFRRSQDGRYDISDEYFMPVVRDIPVFPEGDVQPGESWQATGEEAHDFREVFGIQKPFRVPFTANYTYKGVVQSEGGAGEGARPLHHIEASYVLFFDTPSDALRGRRAGGIYPVSIKGSSTQQLYWDAERGALSHYTEEFLIRLELNTGSVIRYEGVAEAAVTWSEPLDRERLVQEISEEIKRQNIAGAHVESSNEGITITLENIQFEANSERLLPGEEEKVRRIARIIARYPDKDLLITGHTALAGSAASRQELSEARAEAVAAMLISLGAREEKNVFTQGVGADQPIAPNDSPENMARNRRVEITILEK